MGVFRGKIWLAGICLWAAGAFGAEILSNADIVDLVKSGLGEAIIKEKINNSENVFDVSAKALISLKSQQVPESLIQLMYSEALKNHKKLRSRIAAEIQNLAAENEYSRRTAKVFLKKVNSAALPQLREALAGNSPAVRVAAAQMLGAFADRDSVPLLQELLSDKDRNSRLAAAETLAEIGDTGTRELAKQNIKLEQEPLDGFVHFLGCSRDNSVTDKMVVLLLKAFSPETRAEAAWALGAIGDRRGVQALEEALQHDMETSVKRNAAVSLGQIAAPESFAKLLNACHNIPAVRTETLTAIGKYPARRAVPFLISSLPQPMKPEEKQATVKALRHLTGRDFGNDKAAWDKWLQAHAAELDDRNSAPEKSPVKAAAVSVKESAK